MKSSLLVAYLAAACTLGSFSAVHGAVITPVFTEQFEDSTLEAGVLQNGTPAFAGGFVDLDGNNANGLAQGFYIDPITPYSGTDGGAGPEGGGPSVSFIMEALIGPDGVAGSDGMGAVAPSGNDVLFSFNGRYGLRFATATNWSLFTRIAGGTGDVNSGIPNAADRPSAGSHVAIVFTNNGATDTLAYYKNGVLAHSVTGDFNRFNISRASWGLEINSGAALSRGFNGTFDAISFATFTGAFDRGAGDQFVLPVPIPEPATWGLALVALVAASGRVRRRQAYLLT